MPLEDPRARPTGSDLARDEAKVDRFVRVAGGVVGGGLVGLYVAVGTYDGPSFSTAFTILGVIGAVVGVLSFVFGRRFWKVLIRVLAPWH